MALHIYYATQSSPFLDQVKVTVIATGFDETRRKYAPQVIQDQETMEGATSEQTTDGQIDEDEFDIPTYLRQIR